MNKNIVIERKKGEKRKVNNTFFSFNYPLLLLFNNKDVKIIPFNKLLMPKKVNGQEEYENTFFG